MGKDLDFDNMAAGNGNAFSGSSNRKSMVSGSTRAATTGMRFMRIPRYFVISISKGLSLKRGERFGEKWRCGRGQTCDQSAGWTLPGRAKASVHPEIQLVGLHGLLLLSHVCLISVIEEVNDKGPRVAVLDGEKARCDKATRS